MGREQKHLQCPGGHKVKPVKYQRSEHGDTWPCSACASVVPIVTKGTGCEPCGYGLCTRCAAVGWAEINRCPSKGHPLSPPASDATTVSYGCNVCEKMVDVKHAAKGCRECDFDVCRDCAKLRLVNMANHNWEFDDEAGGDVEEAADEEAAEETEETEEQEEEVAVKDYPKCPVGHKVRRVYTFPKEDYDGGWHCNECEAGPFDLKTEAYGCRRRECQYDMCEACYTKWGEEGEHDDEDADEAEAEETEADEAVDEEAVAEDEETEEAEAEEAEAEAQQEEEEEEPVATTSASEPRKPAASTPAKPDAAPSSAAPLTVVKCPGQHPLVYATLPSTTGLRWYCNTCAGGPYACSKAAYSCRKCAFDMCRTCYNKSRVGEPLPEYQHASSTDYSQPIKPFQSMVQALPSTAPGAAAAAAVLANLPAVNAATAPAAAPAAPAKGKSRSLFIGINYFRSQAELHGSINDVTVMRNCVEALGFDLTDSRILVDDRNYPRRYGQPTRKEILKAFEWLLDGAEKDDNFFLHYSGHGGQSPEKDDENEADGLKEWIVPVDMKFISDDEINDALAKRVPAGARLTMVFSSCHSGDVVDLQYYWEWDSDGVNGQMRATEKRDAIKGDVVAFTACKTDQIGYEVSSTIGFRHTFNRGNLDLGSGGVLPNALGAVVAANTSEAGVCNLTFAALLGGMQKMMSDMKFTPIPQMVSSRKFAPDAPFSLVGTLPC